MTGPGPRIIHLDETASTNADAMRFALAGEPLTIKVNGIDIGRAEVVVSGENYGHKVVELSDINLDSLAA
jgi:hypothetical protein